MPFFVPDVVWYWYGGRKCGSWLAADAYETRDLRVTLQNIQRQGYVAVFGRRVEGPPMDPPNETDFLDIGM